MLSVEENERVTRVGPGTPMGAVMRRYWLPALLAAELPAPDCPPVQVRLLGEDLVAFRDSEGRLGLLDEYCPHRQASLFLGRNEQCGLRCVYHGWKFDVAGNCVDMPNEPPEYRFKERIHQIAYPTVELGGIIWAYLGPPALQPSPPDLELLRVPPTHRDVNKTYQECNYLQAIEGGVDSAHISFLHNNDITDPTRFTTIGMAPKLEVEPTDYGFRYAGIRDIGEKGSYVKIYQFIMPFHQMRPAQVVTQKDGGRAATPLVKGHIWVPMDDENTMTYNWMYSADADKPLTEEFILDEETKAGRGPDGESTVRHRTRANKWLIDRELQRTKTFSGIVGLNTQDLAVQESMGRIVNRSREHLGSTDRAVITLRRLMLESVHDVETGGSPPGVDPSTYRGVRSVDVVLPKGAIWQQAAERELVAHW
jgi:phenylpropionate dioxygenase-like ring-hydroxylating dioxygenase large terminal subunit